MTLMITTQKADREAKTPVLTQLREWSAFTLRQQKIRRAELCIRIVSVRESAQLNKRYRHKAGPTNVLSFPAELPEGLATPLLGDLVICATVVNREATTQGKTRAAHWAHMVVHGSLHLLGFDHIRQQDASRMEAEEVKILRKLGFANPYSLL
jgi:probable rRNA maturation factor